ncbi:MAG: VCBS repeat-containing protein [Planctomycetes bacterium]|nr:VCBS repeat-containing protein [Planctomycetota bacterium]
MKAKWTVIAGVGVAAWVGAEGAVSFGPAGSEVIGALAGDQAAWGDVDGDGWLDLFAGGTVWRNRGGKGFTSVAAPAGLARALIADLDGDGKGDLVGFTPLAFWRTRVSSAGELAFEPMALPELPATSSCAAACADVDGDGRLDVFVAGYEDWEKQLTFPSFLLRNAGEKGFALAWTSAEHRSRSVAACDFDEDGDLDWYVSNYRLQPNDLWVNDGQGAFANEAKARNALATSGDFPGGHSIGACFGDFDGDGHVDLFAGNFAHVDERGDQPKSRFLRNAGAAGGWRFEDRGECGLAYQESYAVPACGDFDRDGRLDLYVTTVYAMASFHQPNFPVLMRNVSEGAALRFVDTTEDAGLGGLPPTYMAACADFDRDGDLDLATAGKLYVGAAPTARHWLEVRVTGDGKRVARDAAGVQVRVRSAKEPAQTWTRSVELGSSTGNANGTVLHFGLGDRGGPVEVELRGPKGLRATRTLEGVDRLVELAFD